MLQYIEKFIDINALKEDFRRIGVNCITAGIVGIFINNYVGTEFSHMFWASLSISLIGSVMVCIGILKRRE